MSPIGAMRERLMLQSFAPTAYRAGLTRAGSVATATTTADHGFATNDYVTVAGATPSGYNGKVKVTVTGARSFTYAVSSGLTTPATGTITATYTSDAQGGRKTTWVTVATVWAEMMPIRAMERLQAAAVQAEVDYRFKIRTRADVTLTMQALWTPSWPSQSARKTLTITGVLPFEDGREAMLLEVSERAA